MMPRNSMSTRIESRFTGCMTARNRTPVAGTSDGRETDPDETGLTGQFSIEARKRIEMLREESLLQHELAGTFDI